MAAGVENQDEGKQPGGHQGDESHKNPSIAAVESVADLNDDHSSANDNTSAIVFESDNTASSTVLPPTDDTELMDGVNESKPLSNESTEAVGDNSFAPQVEQTTVSGPSASSSTTNQPPAQSKSAQILLDRFSSWRKLANDNAQALLEKTKKSSSQWTLPTTARRSFSDMAATSSTSSVVADEEEKETTTTKGETATTTTEGLTSLHDNRSGSSSGSSVSSNADHDDNNASIPLSSIPPPPPLPSPDATAKHVTEPLEQRMAGAAVVVKVAASVVADSVATGFRGRYSGKSVVDAIKPRNKRAAPPPPPLIESQTALILKSRAASHMQSILDHLDSHEYVMLLGPGMFGVNLKQTYLKSHGVYVDYLVRGGAAEKSGVVHVGDLLVKVGDTNVRKGTILTVPKTIASARRPVILVLCTGTKTTLERINYIDVAVAMMHRIRHGTAEDTPTSSPTFSHKSLADKEQDQVEFTTLNDHHGAEDHAVHNHVSQGDDILQEKAQTLHHDADEKKDMETNEWNLGKSDIGLALGVASLISPPILADNSVDSFVNPPVPPKAIREFFAPDIAKRCNERFSSFEVRQAAGMDDNFRACLQNAFLTCVIDGRRLPFLSRHLSSGPDAVDSELEDTDAPVVATTLASASTPVSALLMLFLEMMSYVDLYGVTPPSRRREVAHRIAHKYFLPTKVGNNLERPVFDFHHIVTDSILRRLERALADHQIPQRDVFLECQQVVLESLSGPTFLSFLMSHECARMRAYLRNTAPFVNVPLQHVFDAVVATNAVTGCSNGWVSTGKNHFLYMLVHLLCHNDKDSGGETEFDENPDGGSRLIEAASGLCCAIFIKRDLSGVFNQFKKSLASSSDDDMRPSFASVFDALRRLWDTFLIPCSGALANSGYSNETEDALASVRCIIRDTLSGVTHNATEERMVEAGKRLADSNFADEANRLANELLYDYGASSYAMYRDHKFHEWMCSELSKSPAINSSSPHEDSRLPSGCIKRLLRKTEFPSGVSSHKPVREARATTSSQRNYSNADFAVVFGTSTGTNLTTQTPNPAMHNTDIRRFACQSVALDRPLGHDEFDDAQVPMTLESYVVFPPTAPRPFADFKRDVHLSVDGWEVSLVNFMIPNADNSSENNMESSLFGVSLVLQKTSDSALAGNNSGSGKRGTTTGAKLAESPELPVFNQHLRGRPWSEKVMAENGASTTVIVGLALASHQNVIPAMRDSLSIFFDDRCQFSIVEGRAKPFACGSLVDILGNFARQDIEPFALRMLLEPHLMRASTTWIDRPLSDQKDAFDAFAGQQLICSLGPVPLALLFVTVLLEQKVVLSSSRRSMLHYSTTALSKLMEPLKWCHLMVPLVPSALGSDLLQYPAPFILGLSSDNSGNMELLNNLPRDVTLVDLDVGRVILAPCFSQDLDALGDANNVSSSALRSQVLYLAQALGGIIGAALYKQAWHCDSVMSKLSPELEKSGNRGFDDVRTVCHMFLSELLEGAAACCYWIEEAAEVKDSSEADSSVLFDEDRFLNIKNIRANRRNDELFEPKADKRLALSLDDFDLLLENFLRCQSMSSYVSSLPQKEMVYF